MKTRYRVAIAFDFIADQGWAGDEQLRAALRTLGGVFEGPIGILVQPFEQETRVAVTSGRELELRPTPTPEELRKELEEFRDLERSLGDKW